MTDPSIIEARALAVRRDGRSLLEGIELDVARGSIHAIIGPNGAGKSTLVAALLGQTEFAGSVRYHLTGSGALGFVPQSFAVDKTLPVTVLEFLALSRQRTPICFGLGKTTRSRCEALLGRVDLAGFGARRLGVLSGGELQRVLFANALDPEPELLFLDEPSSGLDTRSAKLCESILGELRASGTTTVLVSHDIRQIRRVADAVTYVDRTLRAHGTPAEVLGDKPEFPFAEGWE